MILLDRHFDSPNYTSTLIEILLNHHMGGKTFSKITMPLEFINFSIEKGVELHVAHGDHAGDPSRCIVPGLLKEWEIMSYTDVRDKNTNEKALVKQTALGVAFIEYLLRTNQESKWVLMEDLELVPIQGGFRNEGEAP